MTSTHNYPKLTGRWRSEASDELLAERLAYEESLGTRGGDQRARRIRTEMKLREHTRRDMGDQQQDAEPGASPCHSPLPGEASSLPFGDGARVPESAPVAESVDPEHPVSAGNPASATVHIERTSDTQAVFDSGASRPVFGEEHGETPPPTSEAAAGANPPVCTTGSDTVDVPTQAPEVYGTTPDVLALTNEVLSLRQALAAQADAIQRAPLDRVRASALPLAMRCAASLRPVWLRVDEDNEAARLGSAVHAALAAYGRFERADMDALAASYRVDIEALTYLARRGRTALLRFIERLGQPTHTERYAERELPGGGVVTGHVDLAWSLETLVVVDYKTGHRRDDFRDQLKAYAWLGLEEHHEYAAAYVVWVRDLDANGWPIVDGAFIWSAAELNEWAADVSRRAINWDGRFILNELCDVCPLRRSCPAHLADQRHVVETFTGWRRPDQPDQLLDVEVEYLRDRARQAGKAVDAAKSLTRRLILDRGGVGRYEIAQRKSKRIDFALARVVLERAGVTVPPGPLSNKTVYQLAESAGVTDIAHRLSEAGAVTVSHVAQVRRNAKRSPAT